MGLSLLCVCSSGQSDLTTVWISKQKNSFRSWTRSLRNTGGGGTLSSPWETPQERIVLIPRILQRTADKMIATE